MWSVISWLLAFGFAFGAIQLHRGRGWGAIFGAVSAYGNALLSLHRHQAVLSALWGLAAAIWYLMWVSDGGGMRLGRRLRRVFWRIKAPNDSRNG